MFAPPCRQGRGINFYLVVVFAQNLAFDQIFGRVPICRLFPLLTRKITVRDSWLFDIRRPSKSPIFTRFDSYLVSFAPFLKAPFLKKSTLWKVDQVHYLQLIFCPRGQAQKPKKGNSLQITLPWVFSKGIILLLKSGLWGKKKCCERNQDIWPKATENMARRLGWLALQQNFFMFILFRKSDPFTVSTFLFYLTFSLDAPLGLHRS